MTEPQTSSTIAVRLSLFADLRRFEPENQPGTRTFILILGATVADLVSAAGIPPQEDVTIGLNGERGRLDTLLNEGDDVVLFSQMEGG
jgi:molybdopterin converting factor small subunit